MRARILIVEDNSRMREIESAGLREHGYEVFDAGGLNEAAILLRSQGFALVVTDIRLPGGLSGIDLAREVKRLWRGTKVLLVGADLEGFAVDDFRDACDATLAKPFTLEQLRARVAFLIVEQDALTCTQNNSRFVD
ncbi:MAG TPA: response regulator [Stellaceae bacterium]|nr:response regulator [Stellaceae bacterium]